jgi:hypothetical protein
MSMAGAFRQKNNNRTNHDVNRVRRVERTARAYSSAERRHLEAISYGFQSIR